MILSVSRYCWVIPRIAASRPQSRNCSVTRRGQVIRYGPVGLAVISCSGPVQSKRPFDLADHLVQGNPVLLQFPQVAWVEWAVLRGQVAKCFQALVSSRLQLRTFPRCTGRLFTQGSDLLPQVGNLFP